VYPRSGLATRINAIIAASIAHIAALDDPARHSFGHGRVVVTAGLYPAPERLEPFRRKIG
jgi:hypothetical protein